MLSTPQPARWLSIALLSALVAFATIPVSAGSARQEPDPARFAPGEVLIGWTPGAGPVRTVPRVERGPGPDASQPEWQEAVDQVSAATGLRVLDAAPDLGNARLSVRPGREAAEIARLAALPWVRFAEPNYYAYAADLEGGDAAVYPNDPDFDLQWHAHRVAAPEAWAYAIGSTTFSVAVLDTGIAQGHLEFASKLLPGYDYYNGDPSPEDDAPNSHGTHVAGIIAASFNNGQGVAGLAPAVKIRPYKVLGSNQRGPYSAIASAIIEAANLRAQVINLSLVGFEPSFTLQDALNYAIGQGSLPVAAAGNCGQFSSACPSINPTIYPAAYDGVLAVSASDRFDRYAPYTGYKPYIGIAAPGGTDERGVWSSTRAGYGYLSGTSMSAPAVSAAAALVWTLRPAARPDEIADTLKATADKVGTDPFSGEPLSYSSGRNDYFGSGRLNLARAVRQVYPPSLGSAGLQSFFIDDSRPVQDRAIEITNPSGQSVFWQAFVLDGGRWLSVTPPSSTAVYDAPGQLTLRVDGRDLDPGAHWGLVRAQAAGLAPVDIPVRVQVATTARRSFLPETGREIVTSWYDPDAPNVAYRAELQLADNSLTALGLPFAVSFYGATHQLISISDNGYVAFGQGSGSPRPPAYCPGNGAAPNNALYVFAADWDPRGGSVIVHQPNAEIFVVTWQGVQHATTGSRSTFQLVIDRNRGFQANYLALDDPRAGIIGSENEDGIVAEQILCGAKGAPARAGQPVLFNPRAPWQ